MQDEPVISICRLAHPFPHAPLHCEQLSRHAQMQRGQKTPEGALRRKSRHPQDAGQHRFALKKSQMMQAQEPHIAEDA